MAKHPQVVNAKDMEWVSTGMDGTRFEGLRKQLGAAAGGQQLGCSLFQLAPGKSGFPFHAHYANEEAVYILSGQGSARIGDQTVAVAAGDYLAYPMGEKNAHQLTNTGQEPLTYLCLSTMNHPEVAYYPDSQKVGVMAGSAPGSAADGRKFFNLYPADESMDYLDGEET